MEKANIANEMSDEVKKFTLKNVEDFLSDNEMKNTRGGSGVGDPSSCGETTLDCQEDRLWCCKCDGYLVFENSVCATYISDAERYQNTYCHPFGSEAICEAI